MKKIHILAFDIGATSGRAVLAIISKNSFKMEELYRFSNGIMELHGKFYWDIYSIYNHLKISLSICTQKGIKLDSIGIDTWGVDYGCIAKDGTILGLPRSYRDPYTEGAPEDFFNIVSKREIYQRTGIQIMNFNSLYQLYKAKKENYEPLLHADKILFIPDLLSYMLTGEMICEYTDASTSQFINACTKQIDSKLLNAAGINENLISRMVSPGTIIGNLNKNIALETGVGTIPVIAVAGHDTASAVAAVPALDPNFAYLSSGTWSLMGIETNHPIITNDSFSNNFTNEGGIEGTFRFLKNITGMWLLEECRKEWKKQKKDYNYDNIHQMAHEVESFKSIVDPDDESFANPQSMTKAIVNWCYKSNQPVPKNDSEFVRCIFQSLANKYKVVFEMLKEMAPFSINCLHVIGGGSQNDFLNQLTANALNLKIIAGPSEATAIGNCVVQAKAAGIFANRWEYRELIAKSFPTKIFNPKN